MNAGVAIGDRDWTRTGAGGAGGLDAVLRGQYPEVMAIRILKHAPAGTAALLSFALCGGAVGSSGAQRGAEMMEFEIGEILYENPLSGPGDIEDWVVESSREGHPAITFPHGRMRMESDVNFLLWCPEDFPDNIAVSWEFMPRRDAGLAMFWIAATGRGGESIFDPSLEPRAGDYAQYYRGDINALHLSYFRRNPHGEPVEERAFQTCNLRKSHGFHLVAEGADPIPSVRDAAPDLYSVSENVRPYRMQVIKHGPHLQFSINELVVLRWFDDGGETGPVLGGGKIGFRQMRGLIADYGNLRVSEVAVKEE